MKAVYTRGDAEEFLVFFGRLLKIEEKFVDLLVEGRPGEPIPKDMLLRDYWTDREVDLLFRAACEAAGISDPTTIDGVNQLKTDLQEVLTGLQEPLRRACDFLGITKEGRNRLGLFDS